MSLELVQLPKCANVFCENRLQKATTSIKSLDRFCLPCKISNTILTWKCLTCDNIISSQCTNQIFCKKCKYERRTQYWKAQYERRKDFLKIRRLAYKQCRRCGGKITNVVKRDYCSDYCYWLNKLRQRNHISVIRSLKAVRK